MARQQLPPQITKVELKKRENGKPAIRYQIVVDVGKQEGKRRQIRTRTSEDGEPLKTEAQARAELARIQASVSSGTYVHDEKLTVEKVCEDWLASKHSLKKSTLKGHRDKLRAVMLNLGEVEVLKLTKGDIDRLIVELRDGTAKGCKKPWSARSVNYMLSVLTAALKDLLKQGRLVKNVAALVDRLPSEQKEMKTLTQDQMYQVFDHECWDQHLWVLGLHGLRRGEIAGLRWVDIDYEAKTLSIVVTRVAVGKETLEGTPKSERSKRTLPMPDDVIRALKAAQARQDAEQLKSGDKYVGSGFVAVDELGRPYKPSKISFRWGRMLDTLSIPRVRLHDSRHTCATIMHLRGVPIAVIAAWLGHASAAFTQNTYAHSQDEALVTAAQTFSRVVTTRDNVAVPTVAAVA